MARTNSKDSSAICGLGALFDGYEKSIRPALDAVDEIRPYVKDIPEISDMLPAIVVVGEQSAGKSSLLEAISGIGLPRGSGMCTKVPLELQLRETEEKESITLSYISNNRTEVVRENIPFCNVTHEIESATRNIVGDGKVIRDQPITLRVCGPKMKDLTLIDLPGITRASNNREVPDIEAATKTLTEKYIRSESKVIVCALPANVDFSNSGALKISQQVDPEGKRTLGVVTKIDTYEKRNAIKQRLEGTHLNEIKLKLGYVAVRCRNNVELQEGASLEKLHAIEQELFKVDEELRTVRKDFCGTPVLIKKLIDIQRTRLEDRIPQLIKELDDTISARERDLSQLKHLPTSRDECFSQIVVLLHAISDRFKDAATNAAFQDQAMDARNQIYNSLDLYKKKVRTLSHGVFTDTLFSEIKKLTETQRGHNLPNFLSSTIFNKIFVEKFLISYKDPAKELIEKAHRTTISILHKITEVSIPATMQNACSALKHMVDKYVEDITTTSQEFIENEIEIYKEIFTPLTPAYQRCVNELRGYFSSQGQDPRGLKLLDVVFMEDSEQSEKNWLLRALQQYGDDPEACHCLEMMISVASLLNTVCNCVLEYIPRYVLRTFVTKLQGNGSGALVPYLLDRCSEARDALFRSVYDPTLVAKRESIEQSLKDLHSSKSSLRRIFIFS